MFIREIHNNSLCLANKGNCAIGSSVESEHNCGEHSAYCMQTVWLCLPTIESVVIFGSARCITNHHDMWDDDMSEGYYLQGLHFIISWLQRVSCLVFLKDFYNSARSGQDITTVTDRSSDLIGVNLLDGLHHHGILS